MDLRPGDEVLGESAQEVFTIEKVLGSGGFGIVYLVRDRAGMPFALKTIASAFLNDTELAALVNEGRSAVGIRHPNVLSILYLHDGATYPNLSPYMLMEYAEGGTLADVIRQRRADNKFFEPDELREMMKQLAAGMEAISQQLVHRDLKPDNVLLKDGNLKIADFGLAKLVGAATRSQTFKGIAHIMYAAPEAWKFDSNLPAMDIYSMGLMFFELATLQHPYSVPDVGNVVDAWCKAHLTTPVPDPRIINPCLDLSMVQLIQRMTAKRAAERYQTWPEILARLSGDNRTESKVQPDVRGLVEKALKTKAQQDSVELAAERVRLEAEEKRSLVEVAFREITNAAHYLVETFNESSDVAKLKIEIEGLTASVYKREGNRRKKVSMGIEPIPQGHTLDLLPVLAWGGVVAPSGKGFNLILIQLRDDIYGQWRTLHNEHTPGMRQDDNRPVPFPFTLGELPNEIVHLNAFHIYQSRKGSFQTDQLIPLFEELV
jgi:eukaryotic-like serine/threonine-protein kinase